MYTVHVNQSKTKKTHLHMIHNPCTHICPQDEKTHEKQESQKNRNMYIA